MVFNPLNLNSLLFKEFIESSSPKGKWHSSLAPLTAANQMQFSESSSLGQKFYVSLNLGLQMRKKKTTLVASEVIIYVRNQHRAVWDLIYHVLCVDNYSK